MLKTPCRSPIGRFAFSTSVVNAQFFPKFVTFDDAKDNAQENSRRIPRSWCCDEHHARTVRCRFVRLTPALFRQAGAIGPTKHSDAGIPEIQRIGNSADRNQEQAACPKVRLKG